MQLPTPEDLTKRRREIGLAIRNLAKRARLIQSIIAHIESEDVDPRLFTVRKILDIFEKAENDTADSHQESHSFPHHSHFSS
jgi:predicted transcriptional regulator